MFGHRTEDSSGTVATTEVYNVYKELCELLTAEFSYKCNPDTLPVEAIGVGPNLVPTAALVNVAVPTQQKPAQK
jgi:hypothetical protein